MIQIILWELGFYYYKNCPQWLLKESVLKFLKGRVLSCVGNVIYIERINEWELKRQFIY